MSFKPQSRKQLLDKNYSALSTAIVLGGHSGSWPSCEWPAGFVAMIGLSLMELGPRFFSEFISSYLLHTCAGLGFMVKQ
jgi:hypothetical protein